MVILVNSGTYGLDNVIMIELHTKLNEVMC